MTLQTYEGSWEDVQLHGNELAGHRVRVTVLDIDGEDMPFNDDPEKSPDVLADRLMAIGQRCAALPVLDTRPEEDILGYNTYGFPG